jgi:hypothetical protein
MIVGDRFLVGDRCLVDDLLAAGCGSKRLMLRRSQIARARQRSQVAVTSAMGDG